MKSFLTYILLLASLGVSAQNAILKGKVVSQGGYLQKGAMIHVVGVDTVFTNELGYYIVEVPSGRQITIYASVGTERTKNILPALTPGKTYQVDFTLDIANEIPEIEFGVTKREPYDGVDRIKPRVIESFPTVGGAENLIAKVGLGTNQTTELSSGYNVRGGNFDENLVYINNIEVYRPFLARSGQQEGLSLINIDLVEDISFSAGGFEAQYGDKLSSVLDIRFKDPKEFKASTQLSLLGAQFHFEGRTALGRLSYLFGARYRSNGYLLGSLDVQADYNPRFYDVQSYISYDLTVDAKLSWFSSFSQNRYLVSPQSRTTNFGTAQTAFQLFIGFGGSELMQYSTIVNGLNLDWDINDSLNLNFTISSYNSQEREHFTVEGAYRLNELETNLGADNFAEANALLGFGYFIDNARNDLVANVIAFNHQGKQINKWGTFQWGATYKMEIIRDVLKEWRFNDSSGYNLVVLKRPNPNNEIILDEYLRSNINLQSQRVMGFVQQDVVLSKKYDARLNIGVRSNYWTYNNENVISPRAQFSFKPNKAHNDSLRRYSYDIFNLDSSRLLYYDSAKKQDWTIRAAGGYYYQPPFYRELRNLQGQLNPELLAQRSIHAVLGGELEFNAWGRPFKLVTEAYYKHLDRTIPYIIDNVRIRYLAENSGQGYATGFDARVNGEFINGIESWFNFSLLQTKERLYYTDENGQEQRSDWLRRPTDQRVNFSILFQDELPSNPSYKMNLNLVFGSRIPFFFSGGNRYVDGFTIPPYRRVDIGFSKVIITGDKAKVKWLENAQSLWISLEVFNLLQVNNTISYVLIKDFNNNIYGVPNYLTGRRLNLRLILKI
ncbi:TonB-dependent receptor [bacterium]|nr:TonB-dependent receptor [bacterium]